MTTRLCAATRHKLRTGGAYFEGVPTTDSWNVLRLAGAIDDDQTRVRDWYQTVGIRELGGKTALELVQTGEADLVMGFLRSIRHGQRD